MDQNILKTFESAFQKIDSSQLIRCVLILFIAIVVYIALRIVYRKYRRKLVKGDDIKRKNAVAVIYRVLVIALVVVTLLAIMQVFGINISSILIGFGLISTILAFAVKDALQDIFTGVMIRTDRFFKVGDAVEYDGKDGIVIAFTMRSTKIEFLDDRSVMSVANRHISKIRALTHLVDIDLPLSYDEHRRDVFEVLSGICERIRGIEGVEDCMLKGTQRFAESAVVYKIRFFCEPNDRPDIRREVLKTIQDGLDEAGIRIPYKQIDIHEK